MPPWYRWKTGPDGMIIERDVPVPVVGCASRGVGGRKAVGSA